MCKQHNFFISVLLKSVVWSIFPQVQNVTGIPLWEKNKIMEELQINKMWMETYEFIIQYMNYPLEHEVCIRFLQKGILIRNQCVYLICTEGCIVLWPEGIDDFWYFFLDELNTALSHLYFFNHSSTQNQMNFLCNCNQEI